MSKQAAATVERYRAFVQEQNAPIAHMNYAPFPPATRSQAESARATRQEGDARRGVLPS